MGPGCCMPGLRQWVFSELLSEATLLQQAHRWWMNLAPRHWHDLCQSCNSKFAIKDLYPFLCADNVQTRSRGYLFCKLFRSMVEGEKATVGKHRINLILICCGTSSAFILPSFEQEYFRLPLSKFKTMWVYWSQMKILPWLYCQQAIRTVLNKMDLHLTLLISCERSCI